MCVICYKPVGVKPPTKEILKSCWERNSDGAGYAYYNNNLQIWNCHKGFLTFKSFWKSYNAQRFNEENCVVSHFRIGTSGNKTGPECTHPFPVTKDCSEMGALKFKAENIVFHNGVVGQGDKDYSDTMVAVRDVVDLLYDKLYVDNDERAEKLLEKTLSTTSNKWIITNNNTLYTYGTWHEKNGIKFSNLNWEPTTQTYGATPNNQSSYTRPPWSQWNNNDDYSAKQISADDPDVITCVVSKDGVCYVAKETENNPNTFDICPNCYEDIYLDVSHFDLGNCTCLTCGAVFTSETGEIHLFDGQVLDFNKRQAHQKG